MIASFLTRASLAAALGDEHHAGVEIALLAGQPLIDRVADLVGHAPPVLGGRGELQAQQLLLAEGVPQAEVDAQHAVGADRDLAVDQGLGPGRLPVGEARLDVHVGQLVGHLAHV
jgi:hypothetical protein